MDIILELYLSINTLNYLGKNMVIRIVIYDHLSSELVKY